MTDKLIEYASFLRRLTASIIDLIIIISIYALIINIELSILKHVYSDLELDNTKYFKSIFMLMAVSAVLLIIIYFSILESSKLQGGFGKVIMKIWVVDVSGCKLKFYKALIRALLKCISLGIYISYLSILFTKKKITFYDFMLGTCVVNRQEKSVHNEL